MCSAAGTGDVLKVQKLLHHCEDHYEKKESEKEGEEDKKDEKEVDDTFQGFAVIGIALIAMGEDIGAEMSLRQFNHLVSSIGGSGLGHPLMEHTRRCTMVNLQYGKRYP